VSDLARKVGEMFLEKAAEQAIPLVEASVKAFWQAIQGQHPELRAPPREDGEAAAVARVEAELRARRLMMTEPDTGPSDPKENDR
jgi:hypothetical protein